MKRQIIEIDEAKCNGCGLCVSACHEGAIELVNGKAKLIKDDYCDGLGDCLPNCPTAAISFVTREANEYDEEAVKRNKAMKSNNTPHPGCPGLKARAFNRPKEAVGRPQENKLPSQLSQWPVQIKLVAVNAAYFDNADILVAADCTAYAYANIHQDFIKGRITLIGCPKLDEGDYTEKLQAIFTQNNIKSLTILRMEVPCCGGLEMAAKNALKNSGKWIPWSVVTISTEGEIL